MASPPVCVLGFHRSGTSLTARVINVLGVDLGAESDLLAPDEADNPSGYWEPRWMIDLNDEVLTAVGGEAWKVLDAGDGWEERPELEPLREKARALIAEKFDSSRPWGWKDPRTSLTFPFWRTVLPDLRAIVCVRSPLDAVASALRRGAPPLSPWQWGQLWLEYTARAIAETDRESRTIVFYEDLLAEPDAEADRLAAFLGLTPPADRSVLAATTRADLQHHRTSPLDVAADAGLPVEARAVYLALLAGHADPALARAGERTAVELWTSHRNAAELRAALEQDTWAAERIRRELESLQAVHAQSERDLATLRESTSWRFTAPLRRVARAARRGERSG